MVGMLWGSGLLSTGPREAAEVGLLVDKSSMNQPRATAEAALAGVQPGWKQRGSLPFIRTAETPSALLGCSGS